MGFEGRARELLVADLAHNHNSWTLDLDVIDEFIAGEVLKLGQVADVAAEFGAVKLAVLLQLGHRFPNNNLDTALVDASVWEFAEVDEVLEDFVQVSKEWPLDFAVGTVDGFILHSLGLHCFNLVLELNLAVPAEEFVAALALHRHERKLEANHALDLFDHLPLQLVLNLVQLNVKRRHRFRSQDVGDLSI